MYTLVDLIVSFTYFITIILNDKKFVLIYRIFSLYNVIVIKARSILFSFSKLL